MKKTRTIKIIKSGNTQSVQAAGLAEQNSRAKNQERGHVKAVEGWVSEHQEQRLLAEKIALKLLYDPMHADKLKDEFSNC
jgi:hypothetical protein